MAIFGFITAKQVADGQTPTNPPPTDPNSVKVLEIVKAWATKTDAELWQELALFVRVNEDQVSLSDEILFLRTIESISKQVSWIWPTMQAKDNAIATSVADYTQSGSTYAMYEQILSHQYLNGDNNQTTTLPRKIAAEILKLAVARISRTPA